jgi:NAD(P)-dependent dehydrogenase (short-subunit alcohol dehydrogenase family)
MSTARGPVEGRTIVITGAAGGIGRALSLHAADKGMAVVAADVDEAGLQELGGALEAKGARYLTRRLDVSDTDAVDAFAKEVFDWSTSVALVFANAGIMRMMDGLRPDMKGWAETIDVNLRGPVNMVHGFLGRLLDQPDWSQFVITGSQASFIVTTRMTPYIATKHAVWGLADALRSELKETDGHVGISLIAPGRVRSGITLARKSMILAAEGTEAAQQYDGVLAEPEAVARLVLGQAIGGQFWIVPSPSPYAGAVRPRFEELLAAEASGQIR